MKALSIEPTLAPPEGPRLRPLTRDEWQRMGAAGLFVGDWVINLRDRIVQVHTDPDSGRYRRITPYRRGERIRLLKLPEVEIAVEEFLPERSATGGDRG